MAVVVMFHSVLGLRPGVLGAADRLRAAGHTVHTPDLFDGEVFDDIDEGMRKEGNARLPGDRQEGKGGRRRVALRTDLRRVFHGDRTRRAVGRVEAGRFGGGAHARRRARQDAERVFRRRALA
jgi:dienelactone hydrolase